MSQFSNKKRVSFKDTDGDEEDFNDDYLWEDDELYSDDPFDHEPYNSDDDIFDNSDADLNVNDKNRKRRLTFDCIICLTEFPADNLYGTNDCDHEVCQGCIRAYFMEAVKDDRYNNYEILRCPSPGCNEAFFTSRMLPYVFSDDEINQWWNLAINKAYINNKVTCPMEDCRKIFDVDVKYLKQRTFSECPECHRGFCIACQGPWHPGEVKITDNKNALKKTLEHAQKSNWCHCPSCGFIVELKSGCTYVRCKCGTSFCYRCGRNHAKYDNGECYAILKRKLSKIRKTMFEPRKNDD